MSTQTGSAGGYSSTHYDILRYVAGRHSTTFAELLVFIGSDPRGHMRKLHADKMVFMFDRKSGSAYVITTKGQRLLAKVDAGHGDVAGPREAINSGPWKPKAWTYARSGADQAFQIPSLGEQVRKAPVLIGSKVMQR